MFSKDIPLYNSVLEPVTMLRMDDRTVVANPNPNPPPPEVMNKPQPPFRKEEKYSAGVGDSAPERKYVPPMPPEHKTSITERCKYCEAPDDDVSFIVSGYIAEDRKDNIQISAFLHRDTMIFSANYLTLAAEINFCPMCGRNLLLIDDSDNRDWMRGEL